MAVTAETKADAHLLEGLHADAKAVDAQRHVRTQLARVKSARVRLHADLCAGSNAEARRQSVQDARELQQAPAVRLVPAAVLGSLAAYGGTNVLNKLDVADKKTIVIYWLDAWQSGHWRLQAWAKLQLVKHL